MGFQSGIPVLEGESVPSQSDLKTSREKILASWKFDGQISSKWRSRNDSILEFTFALSEKNAYSHERVYIPLRVDNIF